MVACAVTDVLLIQSALKAGALAAPVAVLTVGDPLLSVGIAVIVGGVVVLAGLSTAASSGQESKAAREGARSGSPQAEHS
jgi:hypothetical protein